MRPLRDDFPGTRRHPTNRGFTLGTVSGAMRRIVHRFARTRKRDGPAGRSTRSGGSRLTRRMFHAGGIGLACAGLIAAGMLEAPRADAARRRRETKNLVVTLVTPTLVLNAAAAGATSGLAACC